MNHSRQNNELEADCALHYEMKDRRNWTADKSSHSRKRERDVKVAKKKYEQERMKTALREKSPSHSLLEVRREVGGKEQKQDEM